MEDGTSVFTILAGKVIGKRLLEDTGVNGITMLEWILNKYCRCECDEVVGVR